MDNKIILVTGGAKGLGAAIVESLAKRKCKVYFTYLNSVDRAKKLEDNYKGYAFGLQSDSADESKARNVISKIIELEGKIDVLVNNVYAARDHSIDEHSLEDFEYTLKHTLYPTFMFTSLISPHFIKQKGGRIINIGSINGLRGREGSVAYSTAKAGIVGLTKTVAKELGEYNVSCNVVAPGFIDTDSQKNTSSIIKKVVLNESAIRKIPKAYEIARLIEYLALDDMLNITGEVFKIDCGQYI